MKNMMKTSEYLCFYLKYSEISKIRGLSIAHTTAATVHRFSYIIR